MSKLKETSVDQKLAVALSHIENLNEELNQLKKNYDGVCNRIKELEDEKS